MRRKIIEENNDLYLFGNPGIVKYNKNENVFKTLPGPATSIYDVVKTTKGYYAATEGKGLILYNNKLTSFTKTI